MTAAQLPSRVARAREIVRAVTGVRPRQARYESRLPSDQLRRSMKSCGRSAIPGRCPRSGAEVIVWRHERHVAADWVSVRDGETWLVFVLEEPASA